jgi:hypothetical protein
MGIFPYTPVKRQPSCKEQCQMCLSRIEHKDIPLPATKLPITSSSDFPTSSIRKIAEDKPKEPKEDRSKRLQSSPIQLKVHTSHAKEDISRCRVAIEGFEPARTGESKQEQEPERSDHRGCVFKRCDKSLSQ